MNDARVSNLQAQGFQHLPSIIKKLPQRCANWHGTDAIQEGGQFVPRRPGEFDVSLIKQSRGVRAVLVPLSGTKADQVAGLCFESPVLRLRLNAAGLDQQEVVRGNPVMEPNVAFEVVTTSQMNGRPELIDPQIACMLGCGLLDHASILAPAFPLFKTLNNWA
jgi:hypothetical protein